MTESSSESGFEAQPYSGIATFGRCPYRRDVAGADVAVVGIPYDGATSYRSGARLGPRAIREQSLLLWGYNNALQVSPFRDLKVIDYGDVDVIPVDVQATHKAVQAEVAGLLNSGVRVVSLGGDHSLSLPLLRAHAEKYGPVAVVHFDAHPDTWDHEFGQFKYSHGTPFRRAIEEGCIDTSAYVQIGIRGPTAGPADYEVAKDLGARMMTFEEVQNTDRATLLAEVHALIKDKPTYLTFDIDVIDPAFAPGTGTPEIGGFTTYELLQYVRGLKGLNLVGCDLVEVAPAYDPTGITAIAAANFVFEFLSLWAWNQKQSA